MRGGSEVFTEVNLVVFDLGGKEGGVRGELHRGCASGKLGQGMRQF